MIVVTTDVVAGVELNERRGTNARRLFRQGRGGSGGGVCRSSAYFTDMSFFVDIE